MADLCRCHLPMVPPDGLACWWPQRDPEPGEQVLVVSAYGEDPMFLRAVRLRGGWHRRGSGANYPDVTPPVPWSNAGRCWAGRHHAVVDATELIAAAEQRPRLLVTVEATIEPAASGSGLSLNGSGGPGRDGGG